VRDTLQTELKERLGWRRETKEEERRTTVGGERGGSDNIGIGTGQEERDIEKERDGILRKEEHKWNSKNCERNNRTCLFGYKSQFIYLQSSTST
jgi:hypothetical protein